MCLRCEMIATASLNGWKDVGQQLSLCRSCYDYCLSLISEYPDAPHVALDHYNIKPFNSSYEDFIQDLNMVYWKCALKYDKALGMKFSTYALKSLKYAVKDCLTQSHTHGFIGLWRFIKKGMEVPSPLSIKIRNRSGKEMGERASIKYNLDYDLDRPVIKAIISIALRKIPRREARFLKLYYLNPNPLQLKEISELLRCSTNKLSQLHIKAKESLREALGNAFIDNYNS
jgi:RNA polymerase sigma factor (sigma-70 family)